MHFGDLARGRMRLEDMVYCNYTQGKHYITQCPINTTKSVNEKGFGTVFVAEAFRGDFGVATRSLACSVMTAGQQVCLAIWTKE